MPKVSKSPAKGAEPSSSKKKKPAAKLYSSFLPIPLTIPTTLPIPSSSSKPITSVTHYLYARPHTAAASASAFTTSGEDDLPVDRTIFVANLPVDMGEDGLRDVFRAWGVVERVEIRGKERDTLEEAVRGLDHGDEDDEDAEANGDVDVQDTAEDVERGGARFVGDLSLPRKKRKNLNRLPDSVPDIVYLPPLDPRSDSYGPSGLRSAYVIYLETRSITRLMATKPLPIPWDPATYPSNPSGYEYYSALHSALRPSLNTVKAFADSSMARFDRLHSLLLSSRAREKGAGALVDEDGFTVVVRGGGGGLRTGGIADTKGKTGTVGIAGAKFVKETMAGRKKKGGVGAGELPDFYKFQKMDRKRQELADLRSKFEEDKKKVERMRKANRFKPY